MSSCKSFLTGLMLLFFGEGMLYAQKYWTLEECISYALKNNLDLESQKIYIETVKEKFNQSKRSRLPYITARSGFNVNYGKSVDPNTNDVIYNNFSSNNYGISGSINLFNGFIKNNQIAYNRFIYLARIADEKTLQTDIAFEVMNAFHNSLYYSGLLEIAKQQKELSALNLEKVKKQAEVGISAKTDILEIEARLADEELLVIRTENNLKASLLELKRAMNFPVQEELPLQDIPEVDIQQSVAFENADSVFLMALDHLPEVRSKVSQLKAVEKSLVMAKGELYPSVSLSGGYYTGYYETRKDQIGKTIPFRDQLNNNASQNIGISITIPVFNRWYSRSDIRLNKLALEKEKVSLENYKNQLFYEIESYCQELSAMSAEYIQAKKQTESNQMAYEVSQKKKDQGMINIIEFYTSKNLLSNAQGELLRTRLQYILKRKTIDFYMGKPVFGIGRIEEQEKNL